MMTESFDRAITSLQETFSVLVTKVPPPQSTVLENRTQIRYLEKTPYQAMILMMARYISGLHAGKLLLSNGFCQELVVLSRVQHEIEENLQFTAIGLISQSWGTIHDQFLQEFWSENYDGPMVSRKKIRAYIANTALSSNPSPSIESSREVFHIQSAFIHCKAIAVLDLYCEADEVFQTFGSVNSSLFPSYVEGFTSDVYLGLFLGFVASKAFGDEQLARFAYGALIKFQVENAEQIFPSVA